MLIFMNQTIKKNQLDEWRIKQIHYRNPEAMIETNWWVVLGALLFVGGVIAALSINKALILISILGLLLSLISLYLGYRKKTRGWKIVTARCIDREWKQILGNPGLQGGVRMVWSFILLCEYEKEGQRYLVTPSYWSTTFFTENSLKKFLNRAMTSDGNCRLRVNPENPLQTELVVNGMLKKLMSHQE